MISVLIYVYIYCYKILLPYMYNFFLPYEMHKIFYFFYKLLLNIEFFYTILNYILAVIIKPGNISDIKKSKYFKIHNPYYCDLLKFPQRLKNRDVQNEWKFCKICGEIKPLRLHHCAVCGNCVLKMDHHCPWINNCVGQNNHRYFLLFLFHVLIFSIHITLFAILTYFFTPKIMPQTLIIQKKPSKNKINFICIMGITGVAIELFFAAWNWFLAFNGNTTLEFWASKVNFSASEITNFSFNSWRENLYYIFGQKNIFKILYIPDFKKLPFSGIEVSKFVDPNFSIEI